MAHGFQKFISEVFVNGWVSENLIFRKFPAIRYIMIGRKVWQGEVWRIDSFRAFGERKIGKLKDQPIDYLL